MITNDEIGRLENVALARSCLIHSYDDLTFLREFARLIAERCAQECDKEAARTAELLAVNPNYGCLPDRERAANNCRDRIQALIPTDREN